ncbi:ABC transporter permease [Desulfotruncus alcoholivorax]|uniref:ABC transporter permease n=1 Tax=Desulfotruncus alcoholivorax TaxID=265477 RepID=UPI00041323F4|nr:ABC transporter permease [Desulfotruncus alcoholivorax]
MSKYIVKRVLIVFPTLLAIIFIVFGIMSLTPGDPARMMLGQQASPEAVARVNHELGFDRPFIIRYGDYVVKLLEGDMGNSYRTGRPVFNEIISRLPTTAKLASAAILLAVMIGVPLGILSAVKQYSLYDITGTAAAMLMASIPGFWFGLMAILLFALKLGWLPSNGSDTWVHYILPAITLAIPVSASLLRLTRTTMLETIRQDYVRTARAKGQTEKKVIFHHALKNALLPVVTVAGLEFGGLLGGVVTIETVFSINGVGTLIIDAIRMKDVPQVTGCAIFLAFLFMMVMLIVDILYAYIDPRIRARYQKV